MDRGEILATFDPDDGLDEAIEKTKRKSWILHERAPDSMIGFQAVFIRGAECAAIVHSNDLDQLVLVRAIR